MNTVKLGTICEKIGSGATPRGGKEMYCSSGTALIRSQNVLDFSFSEEGLAYINDDQASLLSNVIVQENDVLLNITGDSVARSCIVHSQILPARVNQHVAILRGKPEEIDYRYLLYYLQFQKPQLLQMASSGATRNALTKVMLEMMDISIPNKDQQRKIADILDCLDRKIAVDQYANNLLYIQTLEKIVQTIYRQWFLSNEISGKWDRSNVFDNVTEVRLKNQDRQDYPVLSVVKEGEFKASEDVFTKQVYSKDTSNYKIVRQNQIAYNPARANIGSIAMLKDYDAGLVSPIYVVFEMKETITGTFFYYYMKEPMFIENIRHHAIGTTRQNFPFEAFKMFELVVPPMELQLRFENIAKPIEQKIAKLIEENEVLTEIRDTFLPKLMSGELPVEVN